MAQPLSYTTLRAPARHRPVLYAILAIVFWLGGVSGLVVTGLFTAVALTVMPDGDSEFPHIKAVAAAAAVLSVAAIAAAVIFERRV
jgi:hypothetical protein